MGTGESPEHERASGSRYPVLSNRTIGWFAAGLVTLGVGLAVLLLVLFGDGQHVERLEAVKTAGTIVLGTGGAAALWLAARRQRTQEIALNQKAVDQQATDRSFAFQERLAEENRRHLERVAAATEHDAAERRITDLYVKAVEQLGADKPAVRHGGLYALERVAQENPAQRQTVVNVICAYLRAPLDEKPDPAESEVRLTAQRIVSKHLRWPRQEAEPPVAFWADIDLDLRYARLVGLDFRDCRVRELDFTGASFSGHAVFEGLLVEGQSRFNESKFEWASFRKAVFSRRSWFHQSSFSTRADFSLAKFKGGASFVSAVLRPKASFYSAKFEKWSTFEDAAIADITFGKVNGAHIDGIDISLFAGKKS
ncbi:pentapeptide repeat-containing protein [Amycolatopsis panacis]|uniref:Pentapeptide repeat-containing protein n=1 Tax=Amycolatopsis panacis TaxID=2340917 RepID=A0A419I4U2_9PSEU|nr:pentapeptide repeat-containing protein [Amycolatopsis panacis]RJQ85547.1 pentapeptide repeat-containing protein [Amycolatopsis panacis]